MILPPAHGEGRSSPMSSMTDSGTPRYRYAKPTFKTQHGKPPELGYDIVAYDLPAIDVQTERRNFPGYTERQYYQLSDIQEGDTSGATDTDSDTHVMSGKNTGGGYTKINQTSGSKSKWPNRRSK